MRAPKSGRTVPAAALNTIALFSASAIARPSAPVITTALSATSLKHLIQSELLSLFKLRLGNSPIVPGPASFQASPPAHLLVQRQQRQ
jgi:hypothetical protein